MKIRGFNLLGQLYDDMLEDPFGDGGAPRITRRQRWLLYAVVGFFVSFLLWASLANINEVARGQGRVVPSTNADRLMPDQPARVTKVQTEIGAQVRAGQVLLLMKPTVGQTDSAATESRYFALLAKQLRLQAEATGAKEISFTPE